MMRFGGVVFVVDCLKLRLDGTFKPFEIHEVDEVLYLKKVAKNLPEIVMSHVRIIVSPVLKVILSSFGPF